MLRKIWHQNRPYSGPAPEGSVELERDGHYLLRGELSPGEVEELRADILEVYRTVPPDMRAGRPTPENADMFRYEMFNRSALCQEMIGRKRVLSILEPLLGGDCHVISCTAWRNPPGDQVSPRDQPPSFPEATPRGACRRARGPGTSS